MASLCLADKSNLSRVLMSTGPRLCKTLLLSSPGIRSEKKLADFLVVRGGVVVLVVLVVIVVLVVLVVLEVVVVLVVLVVLEVVVVLVVLVVKSGM